VVPSASSQWLRPIVNGRSSRPSTLHTGGSATGR
jgi:hypothetical protein